jgi:hypothetical protein
MDARRRGGGILRIKRQDQDSRAAMLLDGHDSLRDVRLAIAHRPSDEECFARRVLLFMIKAPCPDPSRELFGLRPGYRLQRTLARLLVPNRGIVLGDPARAPDQNDKVQDRPPENPWRLDNPPVRQKLLEKLAHRPETGGIRRAKVDEQNADPSVRNRLVAIRGDIGGRHIPETRLSRWSIAAAPLGRIR